MKPSERIQQIYHNKICKIEMEETLNSEEFYISAILDFLDEQNEEANQTQIVTSKIFEASIGSR